jgi:hypothetical protein
VSVVAGSSRAIGERDLVVLFSTSVLSAVLPLAANSASSSNSEEDLERLGSTEISLESSGLAITLRKLF